MARERRSQLPALARRDRDDLRQRLHAGAEIAPGEGGLRLAAQRRDGLGDLSGFGLDLGFQPDRAVGKVGSLERLVGGKGGEGEEESDERGGKAGADRREHRVTSLDPETGAVHPFHLERRLVQRSCRIDD